MPKFEWSASYDPERAPSQFELVLVVDGAHRFVERRCETKTPEEMSDGKRWYRVMSCVEGAMLKAYKAGVINA